MRMAFEMISEIEWKSKEKRLAQLLKISRINMLISTPKNFFYHQKNLHT